MKVKQLVAVFACLVISACESTSDKALLSQKSDLIVVDGVITSENINHLIRLSYPYEVQNGAGAAVSGASITISDGDTGYSLTEIPIGSGNYYTPLLKAVTGKTYLLTISLNGREYNAEDTPPAVEPLDELQYDRAGDLYVLTQNESGTAPNYIRYNLDWSSTASCEAGSNCAGEVYYYDLKSTDVNQIFQPDKEAFYFPVSTSVIRKKSSLSPAYRMFIRSMLSETEWHGGIFDVQPAPVNTNLSAGAIGFFAVSTVVSDTTIIVAKP